MKIRLFISPRNLYNSLKSIEEKPIFKCRRAAYSVIRSIGNFNSSWSKILCMSVLLASLKKNLVNSNQEKMETSLLRHPRVAYSVVSSRIWSKLKLIQALMHVLITCKYQKDPNKSNREKVLPPFSLLSVYVFFLSAVNGNSSEILCMSSLPATFKRIESKAS